MFVMLETGVGWLDSLFRAAKTALSWVVNLLPASPFRAVNNSVVAPYLSGLNWILPISEVLAIMQVWLVAITVYYSYMVIARWVKAIE